MSATPPWAGGISCVASITPKAGEDQNEDAVVVLPAAAAFYQGVAVADGVGSCARAREAAQFAIGRVEALAATLGDPVGPHLHRLFAEVRRDLRMHAQSVTEPVPAGEPAFETTLLVGLETPTQLAIAYVGNGAIWHLRGNFTQSINGSGQPWSAVNYLNPQSVLAAGREVLYGLISEVEGPRSVAPTVLAVDKDDACGDLLVLCTDGIYSADQVPYGNDAKGQVWTGVEPAMVLLYRQLEAFFERRLQEPACGLAPLLEAYLLELKERQLLEDDATLGVLVTQAALDYQQRLRGGP
jgi:PPM family protein phosphatase